jgi:hypothetical protein
VIKDIVVKLSVGERASPAEDYAVYKYLYCTVD